MEAQYVFGVRVRLEPDRTDVSVEPETVEATISVEAAEPGTDGWRFFRDTLWHGELADSEYGRRLAADWLEHAAEIDAVDFRELRTDEAYLEALRAEIEADLEAFNADSARETLSKYLGSSVRVE